MFYDSIILKSCCQTCQRNDFAKFCLTYPSSTRMTHYRVFQLLMFWDQIAVIKALGKCQSFSQKEMGAV